MCIRDRAYNPASSLVVTGFPRQVGKDLVGDLLSKFGRTRACRLLFPEGGTADGEVGVAFVEYGDSREATGPEAAAACVARISGMPMGGNTLEVAAARAPPRLPPPRAGRITAQGHQFKAHIPADIAARDAAIARAVQGACCAAVGAPSPPPSPPPPQPSASGAFARGLSLIHISEPTRPY